jgi:lipoprotein-anchoring transpeptidase ErfK/SrfK
MLRPVLVVLALAVPASTVAAQWGSPWSPYYGRSPYSPPPSRQDDFNALFGWGGDDFRWRSPAPRFQSGGPRPSIAPLAPQKVSFPSTFPADSVVIDHKGRQLFFVTSPQEALRYPISVGREGFSWAGTEPISRINDWPDWHPPEEMRERDPSLPEKMSGGIRNPLGAKALYLGSSLYRIHGTNDAKSIGRAASSGCFRMLNGHVIDLASRVKIGTVVTVVRQLPADLDRIVSQQVPRSPVLAAEQYARSRDRFWEPPPGPPPRRRYPMWPPPPSFDDDD